MYNDNGNHNMIGCNVCGDLDDSFNYDIINASMYLWYKCERVCSGGSSNSAVKKEHS